MCIAIFSVASANRHNKKDAFLRHNCYEKILLSKKSHTYLLPPIFIDTFYYAVLWMSISLTAERWSDFPFFYMVKRGIMNSYNPPIKRNKRVY